MCIPGTSSVILPTFALLRVGGASQVIYGDTDSIMVYTGSENLQEVVKLGQQIKREVRGICTPQRGAWCRHRLEALMAFMQTRSTSFSNVRVPAP